MTRAMTLRVRLRMTRAMTLRVRLRTRQMMALAAHNRAPAIGAQNIVSNASDRSRGRRRDAVASANVRHAKADGADRKRALPGSHARTSLHCRDSGGHPSSGLHAPGDR